MLTQVGAITTNGVQQQTLTEFSGQGNPTYPGILPASNCPTTGCPGAGVTVFDKNYHNPRIYTYNVGYEQQISQDFVAFVGLHRFEGRLPDALPRTQRRRAVLPVRSSLGPGSLHRQRGHSLLRQRQHRHVPGIFAPGPFATSAPITDTISNAKSLYRGVTFGVRKRMSHHFQFEARIHLLGRSRRRLQRARSFHLPLRQHLQPQSRVLPLRSRRDATSSTATRLGDLPFGFKGNLRIQQHSAEPETDNVQRYRHRCSLQPSTTLSPASSTASTAAATISAKTTPSSSLDFGVARPFHFHDGARALEPRVEVFNTFNNKNNLNPLSSPALFDFNGFLRVGVGDPRQAQLAMRFTF